MEEDLRVIFSTSFHPRQTPERNSFSSIFILNLNIHSITEAYLIYLWIIFKSIPFTVMSLPWALIISYPNSGLLSSCLCCAVLSCSVVSDSLWPHRLQLARILRPWDFPGKNTGVSCHALLQGSSQPRDWTQVSHIAGGFFTIWATREAYLLAYLPQTVTHIAAGVIHPSHYSHQPVTFLTTTSSLVTVQLIALLTTSKYLQLPIHAQLYCSVPSSFARVIHST